MNTHTELAEMPIIVTDATLGDTLATAGRYLMTAGGAYALARGWIDSALLELIVGLVTIVAPGIYGAWKARTNKRKLITAADAAPSAVAQVVR